jgi:hypothetical protein
MSLGTTTTTTLTNILKTKYPQSTVDTQNYEDAAFFGTVGKDTKFGGNNTRISIGYGRSQGGGTYAEAVLNASADDYAAFTLTRTSEYHLCTMSAEAIHASDGKENALIAGFASTHKHGFESFKRSLSLQLYRNGGGARGRISSGSNVTTNTVTLAEPSDAVHFEVNLYLQAASTDGTSGSLRNSGAKELVAAVNRNSGTIRSTSAAWDTTITAIAASDYLFRSGDFGTRIKGLGGWIPATDPTSGDSFFGVDRSVDTVRLAGVRFTATAGAAKEDTLIDCAVRLGREGGNPSHIFCNNLDRADIVKSLGSHAVYDKASSSDGKIGYRALILEGDKGELKVLADPNCPKGTFYMLQLKNWTFASMMGIPHLVEDDGRPMVRQANSDGVEWRLRSWTCLYTDKPGYQARGTF